MEVEPAKAKECAEQVVVSSDEDADITSLTKKAYTRAWNMLPGEFPPSSTVYSYYRKWQRK